MFLTIAALVRGSSLKFTLCFHLHTLLVRKRRRDRVGGRGESGSGGRERERERERERDFEGPRKRVLRSRAHEFLAPNDATKYRWSDVSRRSQEHVYREKQIQRSPSLRTRTEIMPSVEL